MHYKTISYREPTIADGAAIWRLVHQSGGLDTNSAYCYLLLSKDFAETCAVAESEDGIVGFVTAYLPPGRGDTLFVWQIGIAPNLRGKGVATGLLLELMRRDACNGIAFLEATVSPSNLASRALFASLAQRLGTTLAEYPCFDATLFPDTNHEPEHLLRAGPFTLSLMHRKPEA